MSPPRCRFIAAVWLDIETLGTRAMFLLLQKKPRAASGLRLEAGVEAAEEEVVEEGVVVTGAA